MRFLSFVYTPVTNVCNVIGLKTRTQRDAGDIFDYGCRAARSRDGQGQCDVIGLNSLCFHGPSAVTTRQGQLLAEMQNDLLNCLQVIHGITRLY